MQGFAFLTLDGTMRWARNLQLTVCSLVSHLLCDYEQVVRPICALFSYFQICLIIPNSSTFQVVLKMTPYEKGILFNKSKWVFHWLAFQKYSQLSGWISAYFLDSINSIFSLDDVVVCVIRCICLFAVFISYRPDFPGEREGWNHSAFILGRGLFR